MSDADTVAYVRAEIDRLLDEQGPDGAAADWQWCR
jgi:hypothetical protein